VKNIGIPVRIHSERSGMQVNQPRGLNEFVRCAVEKYSKTVAKTAFAYLKNTADAEDVTQEVFLTLMQKAPAFESEEHLKAWLIRVTINKSRDFLKSGWFKSRTPLYEELPYLTSEQNDLLAAVLSLDVKYRLPIHLYYYEGYSIKEIAEILGERATTIGTRLARGRKILKDILKDKIGGFEDE
jgi:RNA polymerase sigma factor (sigma-70 family)